MYKIFTKIQCNSLMSNFTRIIGKFTMLRSTTDFEIYNTSWVRLYPKKLSSDKEMGRLPCCYSKFPFDWSWDSMAMMMKWVDMNEMMMILNICTNAFCVWNEREKETWDLIRENELKMGICVTLQFVIWITFKIWFESISTTSNPKPLIRIMGLVQNLMIRIIEFKIKKFEYLRLEILNHLAINTPDNDNDKIILTWYMSDKIIECFNVNV